MSLPLDIVSTGTYIHTCIQIFMPAITSHVCMYVCMWPGLRGENNFHSLWKAYEETVRNAYDGVPVRSGFHLMCIHILSYIHTFF